jgi:hypothetical protein
MVNNLFETLVSKVCGVLPSEGVVNLKENLNFRFVGVDIVIPSIDEAANGRLRNPSHHLIVDCPFNSIEDIAAVSEDVFNIALSVDQVFEIVLPGSNLWKLLVIPVLDAFDFDFEKSDAPGEALWGSEVVGSVAEGFEEFIGGVVLIDGRVTVVFLSDFDVGFQALREHLLHFLAVRLPNHDAKIS